jgi:hypothetical protein
MRRKSKEQIRADEFRVRAAELMKDPDWLEEGVRYWLEKQLRRPRDSIYTENEHAALARVIAANTLFDGWDGYSVVQLRRAACCYKADGLDEDEQALDELEARNATKLRLREMRHLVGFCRSVAGVSLAPFKPNIVAYDDFA